MYNHFAQVVAEKAMIECRRDLKRIEGLEASEPHGYHLGVYNYVEDFAAEGAMDDLE